MIVLSFVIRFYITDVTNANSLDSRNGRDNIEKMYKMTYALFNRCQIIEGNKVAFIKSMAQW